MKPITLILIALWANFAHGMAEVPPSGMQCRDAPFANSSYRYIKCEFPPYISHFVTANMPYGQVGALLIPTHPLQKLKLRAHFDGYSANLEGFPTWNQSSPTEIVTKNVPNLYPRLDAYPDSMLDWGGPNHGENAYGWRIAALLAKATKEYSPIIDYGAGILFEGPSYGGTTAILQSVILPDIWARYSITVVNVQVPNTLFVKQTDPIGMYWRNPAVRIAWGTYDWTQADIVRHADSVRHIYYRLNGSPADTTVAFDLDFFREVCEKQKIACMGTWHNAGHNPSEPGINLPFTALYSGPDMSYRLDTMQPIFTRSTANFWGPRGHYNLGLEFRIAGFIDTATRVVTPVRYLHRTGMGGEIPDQPQSVTFDYTLRRFKAFNPKVGEPIHWAIGAQSGSVTVEVPGEITIPNVTLESSETYSALELTK